MKVKVSIVKATGLFNVEMGGTSDPYVVCEAARQKIQTQVINNDLNPVWNYTGEIEWDGKSDMIFSLYDSNTLRQDAFMGKYVLPRDKIGFGFKGVVDLKVEHAEAKGKKGGTLEISVAPLARVSGSFKRPQIDNFLMENPLLMWKSKAKSGMVLGAVNTVFMIYFFLEIQITSLLSNLVLILILCGGVARLAGVQLKEEDVGLAATQDMIRSLAMSSAHAASEALSVARLVVFWEDQGFSVAVLGALYIISGVSRWFDISTVVFLVFNLLFIVPVQMKANQKLIDSKVKPQFAKLLEQKDKLVGKIPKYSSLGIKED